MSVQLNENLYSKTSIGLVESLMRKIVVDLVLTNVVVQDVCM